MVVMQASAQEGAIARWQWHDVGLSFDYPADWQSTNQEGFSFLLVEEETSSFMGLQIIPPGSGESLEEIFDEFATNFGGEPTETSVGGVSAIDLTLPADPGTGQIFRLIGFEADDTTYALLLFSSNSENWDAYNSHVENVLATVEITPVELDVATLDEQLLASFEESGTLRIGDADAPLLMVEVLDFSCPHCASYSSSIKRVVQDHVLTGDVQLEFRVVTFVGEEFSEAAAYAQYCSAAQGIGWQGHELLFELHFSETSRFYTVENLVPAFAEIGADAEAFEACMNDTATHDLVARDVQLAAEEFEVRGTPSLLFAKGDEAPAYITGADGEPVRGGIALQALYDYIADEISGDL